MKKSTDQLIKRSIARSTTRWTDRKSSPSIDQRSQDQTTNRSIDYKMNQSREQSIKRPINHNFTRSQDRPIKRSADSSISNAASRFTFSYSRVGSKRLAIPRHRDCAILHTRRFLSSHSNYPLLGPLLLIPFRPVPRPAGRIPATEEEEIRNLLMN